MIRSKALCVSIIVLAAVATTAATCGTFAVADRHGSDSTLVERADNPPAPMPSSRQPAQTPTSQAVRTSHEPMASSTTRPATTQPTSRPALMAEEVIFARNAFPPTLPDDQDHLDAWRRNDCLDCHETGSSGAMRVRHEGMSEILLKARCRTCHVYIPGGQPDPESGVYFARNAFPPMLPNNEFHERAWSRKDCLLCHENGVYGAPKVRHEGMAKELLQARCRTCHIIDRSAPATGP